MSALNSRKKFDWMLLVDTKIKIIIHSSHHICFFVQCILNFNIWSHVQTTGTEYLDREQPLEAQCLRAYVKCYKLNFWTLGKVFVSRYTIHYIAFRDRGI